jgi:hypothetical protein
MIEIFCSLALCIKSVIAPQVRCYEENNIRICRTDDGKIYQTPTICDKLTSFNLKTDEEIKQWRDNNCPLG